MAISGTVKVSTEEMENKANEMNAKIQNMKKSLQQLRGLINKSTSYWQGDAANKYRSAYKSYESEINNMMKKLNEHSSDLLVMAGIYKEAESANDSLANTLPDDVIE